MAARGSLFGERPTACPFVALELDRDRRSQTPDYRHRCYAEPNPAPRTIAHQDQFCLSPNFAACPIFMDWAVRAAARPVPLPQGYERRPASQGTEVADAISASAASESVLADPIQDAPATEKPILIDAPVVAAASAVTTPSETNGHHADRDDEPARSASVSPEPTAALPEPASTSAQLAATLPEPSAAVGPPAVEEESFDHTTWPDSMATAGSFLASRSGKGSGPVEQQQLSAFDAEPAAALEPAPAFEPVSITPEPDYTWERAAASAGSAALDTDLERAPDRGRRAALAAPSFDSTYDEAYARRIELEDREAAPTQEAPLPGFLEGRESQPRPSRPRVDDGVKRGDVVPSWGIDGRYGAQTDARAATDATGRRVLTAVAAVLIIGLALLAIVVIPGLLNGGASSSPRGSGSLASLPRPSAASSLLVVLPSPTAVAQGSVAPATTVPGTPTPTATPDRTPRPSSRLYKVKPGDTMGEIAAQFGVTVAQIMEANPEIGKPSQIRAGQTIVIPRRRQ